MLKWFNGCKSVKEAKSLYHKLCRQYHPDMSGSDTTAQMQEINAEFAEVFERLQQKEAYQQHNTAHETDNSNTTTKQTAEKFMAIIQRLVKCEGLIIEIVGSWIWLSGDTFKYMRCIKGMGFKYSTKHKKYYLADDSNGARKRSRYTFEQICDKNGYQEIEAETAPKLTA